MHVLHVSQPTTEGVPRVVADLVADQVARGWQVTVACPSDGRLAADAVAAGGRHVLWTAGRAPGPATVKEALALRAVVRAAAPHLVHLHSAKAGLAGRLVLRGRLPTVFQPHAWSFHAVEGALRSATTAWERWATRWCDAVAVVSDDERRQGEAAGVAGSWAHLPNGVDLRRRRCAGDPERERARARLGLPAGPHAVCVGRLAPQKGQDVLLQSWDAVVDAVPDAQLHLVGDGPDAALLAARAGRGVTLHGAAQDPDDWFVAADVVVLPSRWEAGLSLTAMEAMALGRSVVLTDVAGASEGLAKGGGLVVPVGDPAAIAAAVSQRLLDPDLAAAEGAEARRTVERDYDLAVTSGRAADLYRTLLRSRTTDGLSVL